MAHLPQYFLSIVLLSLLLDIYVCMPYIVFYALNSAFLPYIIAQCAFKQTPLPPPFTFPSTSYNIILRSHLILE